MSDRVIGGRYRLEHVLGRGGMSEVYRAHDIELDRRVALKLLAPDADSARFEREARAVASLAHPNVMQLYDYGEENGRPYMVLEFVPGGTLEERLVATNGKPLPDDESQTIAAGVAAGLAHAHARGVVHRDLKPANVLFDDDGRPKLADFGIARMAVGEGTLTEAGTVLGTAAYISPEQAAGLPATPASDVYSFGVLLFRMLTGTLPFVSEDPLALVVAHRDEPPPLVAELRPDAPPALAATADAALAKDSSARPADGATLLDGLAGSGLALAADTEVTRVMPAATPPRRRSPFGRALVVALLALLALAGGVLAYEVTRDSNAPALPAATLPSTRPHARSTPATTAQTTAQTTTSVPSTTRPTTTIPTTTHHVTTARPAPTTTRPPTTTAAVTTTTF